MTKIDKIDIENIKLIKKEAGLKRVSKIKIKKNNYEIEISSIDFNPNTHYVQTSDFLQNIFSFKICKNFKSNLICKK